MPDTYDYVIRSFAIVEANGDPFCPVRGQGAIDRWLEAGLVEPTKDPKVFRLTDLHYQQVAATDDAKKKADAAARRGRSRRK